MVFENTRVGLGRGWIGVEVRLEGLGLGLERIGLELGSEGLGLGSGLGLEGG